MDTMPEVNRCFGVFPPKYATFLISVFGMGSGGVGLAGMILYGLMENSILASYMNRGNIDESVRKAALVTIGLTSLLLAVANVILFLGVTTSSRNAVSTGVVVIFAMCAILILEAVGAPLSCFFLDSTCIIKKLSLALTTLGILGISIFLCLWLYFMLVANTYANSI